MRGPLQRINGLKNGHNRIGEDSCPNMVACGTLPRQDGAGWHREFRGPLVSTFAVSVFFDRLNRIAVRCAGSDKGRMKPTVPRKNDELNPTCCQLHHPYTLGWSDSHQSRTFMRHGFAWILILCCFGALFLVCYAPALLLGRQFGYRDAGHYYYPLHERVQTEWNQGRWPLWEPEENAGMPLLGNPTAAVLYPGKLVFFLLPYAWGARVYIVSHTGSLF